MLPLPLLPTCGLSAAAVSSDCDIYRCSTCTRAAECFVHSSGLTVVIFLCCDLGPNAVGLNPGLLQAISAVELPRLQSAQLNLTVLLCVCT